MPTVVVLVAYGNGNRIVIVAVESKRITRHSLCVVDIYKIVVKNEVVMRLLVHRNHGRRLRRERQGKKPERGK